MLRSRIEGGEWAVGEKLPSIETLALQISVARLTLRQALASLEKEGIVDCRQGRGTFVSRDITHQRRLKVATDWSSLVNGIAEATQSMLPVADPPAFPKLNAGDGDPAPGYSYFKSVILKESIPYECMSYHLAKHIVDLDPQAFSNGPVLPRLAQLKSVRVKSARQTMIISTADVETATLLNIPLATPVMLARRVVVDADNIAIFVNEIAYRGDYVRFEVDLMPGSPFQVKPGARRQQRSSLQERRRSGSAPLRKG